MIHTHTLPWDKCLSHQLMPAIQKGWKDEGKDVHFFWGLAGQNIRQITECQEQGLEWWYVDNGYITEQITRYPEPIINNYDKTYFRICKGGIHTTELKEYDEKRLNTHFTDWQSGEHILVCPSSPTVTYFINGKSQDEWINDTINTIKKYTDREIIVREKPYNPEAQRGTDGKIHTGENSNKVPKEPIDWNDIHTVVTNNSAITIKALANGVPVFADSNNCAFPIAGKSLARIEQPVYEDPRPLFYSLAYGQFTGKEMADGTALRILDES